VLLRRGEHLVITERSCWCGFGTDQRTYGTNAKRLGNSSNEIFAFFAPSSLIWLLNQQSTRDRFIKQIPQSQL